MANKNNFTFFDFITEIAKECISSNGTEASPYDVEFANHYQSLYDFENDNKVKNKVPEITKVIQNTKKKSVTAEFGELSHIDTDKVIRYCDDKNLEYDIDENGCLVSVTINKNSKGVMEERKWEKK
jgi:hypothetical protein